MNGIPPFSLSIVENMEDANNFLRWLNERRQFLAVDTETEGFDWWVDRLRTVQFGDTQHGWCIEHERWSGLIEEALSKYDQPIVMHNAKFDMHFLEHAGYTVKRWLIHDSRVMAHLCNTALLSGLKPRSIKELGPYAGWGKDELDAAMAGGGFTFKTVPVQLLWQYAAFDTVLTARLAEKLWAQMEPYRRIYDIELAVGQVLLDMETNGARLDLDYVGRTQAQWEREIDQYTDWLKDQGISNPTSRQQLGYALQREGVQFVEWTASGNPKLTKDILKSLQHPIAKVASRLFQLTKWRTTYLTSLATLGSHGYVHCGINPIGARTGRMSVSRPPLQQLPRSAEIRNCFVAREGNQLLLADYDQVEMRILAHFSQDPSMLEAIRKGDALAAQGVEGWDLHSANARKLFNVPDNELPQKQQRQLVKTAGFALIYGAGINQFSATAGVDVQTGQAFLSNYGRAFPGVGQFTRHVEQTLAERAGGRFSNKSGYVSSPFGRKHMVEMQYAYRGVNYLIQGTAADVMKAQLVKLASSGLTPYMILPIHDEVMFDVPRELIDDVKQTVLDVMPDRENFAVDLTCDAVVVDRWGDKYSYIVENEIDFNE